MAICTAQNQTKPLLSKLVLLSREVPDHLVLTRKWLLQQGFTDDDLAGYVRSGYLSRVGRALYAKPQAGRAWLATEERPIDTGPAAWQMALASSQLTERLPLAVAGYSALQIHNLTHFHCTLPAGNLWVTGPKRLPSWMSQMRDVNWKLLSASKLFNVEGHRPALQWGGVEAGGHDNSLYGIMVSTPERALLEWASQLRTEDDWRHYYEVMEGVATLRPKTLLELLSACKSVKAKRILLWMGKQLASSWYRAIKRDIPAIDLGKGKRQLIPGGMLDKGYQITVVREISSGV